jgi:putative tricarboxylic transport membrane protein
MASRRIDTATLVIALALLILAGLVFWDMSNLQLNAVYGVGPKAMLIVVGAGLAILGIGNAAIALRGRTVPRESLDLTALALIFGGLAALIAVISLGGGFIVATALLFAAVATGFGRRAIVTDLAIGLVLGLCTYLLFAKLLALSLPTGPIERLL